MVVSKKLLKILACPKCKGDVKEQGKFITCSKCNLAYPVLNGNIPDMVLEDAWKLDKATNKKFSHAIRI